MNRSSSDSAVIVSLRPQGENNQTVTLISKSKGVIYATLYGGPKSRLRSLVSQWHSGTVFLYESPEKKQIKISDFDVKNYHQSYSKNLFKHFAASLACEIAIKTKCGGSPEESFRLLSGFLDGLEIASEEEGRLGLIRFLWRYLELLGVQPQTHSCGSCGQSFLEKRFAPRSKSYYNYQENVFFCPECTGQNGILQGINSEHSIFINISALTYLAGLSLLTPAEARRLQIDREDYDELKNFSFFLIENAVGRKLNSIESGIGIL